VSLAELIKYRLVTIGAEAQLGDILVTQPPPGTLPSKAENRAPLSST